MSNAYLINDLQFGSTGKGLLAGALARRWHPDVVVAAWAPNAGHTYMEKDGVKLVTRMIPLGVLSPRVRWVVLGPGSVIDMDILGQEVNEIGAYLGQDLLAPGSKIRLVVHPCAAITSAAMKNAEQPLVKIGSTMKGSGSAYSAKVSRGMVTDGLGTGLNIASEAFAGTRFERCLISRGAYQDIITNADRLGIEGAQGYSLSINHGFYPYTTYRDCTTQQILADCGIPYGISPLVIGTARTYPIRVANRFDADGAQIGYSGPGYPDQVEMSWGELGMEPELTTVTKLPRRVFSFSMEQFKEAITMNGTRLVFLNFVNYLATNDRAMFIERIKAVAASCGARVAWLGWGPTEGDIEWLEWASEGGP